MRRWLDRAVRRRRVPGGVVLDRYAGDGAGGHLRPAVRFPDPRHRRLRRLLHGRRGLSRARAHAEARRAHPRDARARARGTARAARARALGARVAASFLAIAFAYYSVRLAWQSYTLHDISTGNDATPLWLPQLAMAAGTIVFAIAFVDEFVAGLSGTRRRVKASDEPAHVE